MELVLKHTDNNPLEPGKDMLIVVACQSAATAPRACALLKRVARQAGNGGRLIYTWWTFAALESPRLRPLAIQDAAAADMLLITAQEGPGLPEAVSNWIRQWAVTGKTGLHPRVLVSWLEPSQTDQGVARVIYSELKQLAQLGWLDFIANGEDVRMEVGGIRTTVRQLAGERKGGASPAVPNGQISQSPKPSRQSQKYQKNDHHHPTKPVIAA